MKALDIVLTPKGAYGIVTETNGDSACIALFESFNPTGEKCAWWCTGDGLRVVDNLPRILATAMCGGGTGRSDVNRNFPLLQTKDIGYIKTEFMAFTSSQEKLEYLNALDQEQKELLLANLK